MPFRVSAEPGSVTVLLSVTRITKTIITKTTSRRKFCFDMWFQRVRVCNGRVQASRHISRELRAHIVNPKHRASTRNGTVLSRLNPTLINTLSQQDHNP